MAPSEITKALKRCLKTASLPDNRFHDLRHSHVTILLEENVHFKIVNTRFHKRRIKAIWRNDIIIGRFRIGFIIPSTCI
ncbi:hypothetical protein [Mesobacillus thioparans]|uniref:hypothetical protein n=1 Tax=Mesobacillus thioparans TaxID=370439 RepID=UPI0039EE3AE7